MRAPTSSVAAVIRALALARADETAAAVDALRALDDHSRFAAPHSALACVAWQAAGRPDAAVRALEAAARSRDCWVGPMLVDPVNGPLSAIEGFDAVYRSVFSYPNRRRARGRVAEAETRS